MLFDVKFVEHHLLQILKRFDNQNLPLDLFLSQYYKAHHALGSKDRQFISENIYGMHRWLSLIDYLVGKTCNWESRYQVYQHFRAESYFSRATIPPHIRACYPQELFERLKKRHGEEKALEWGSIFNTQAPVSIRINPLKTTREALLKKWEGLAVRPSLHSHLGIVFKKREPLTSFPEFKEGLFEIQDEASQLAALLVQAKPHDHILDYCAGSGGKTLAFAHLLDQKGQIYLHDIRSYALEQAKKRLKRAGIQNAQCLTPHHPSLDKLKRKMDWVFVDAPCTGTGTFRRNPEQKWRFSEEQLSRLIGEQRTIFEKALSFVKPGGAIIYATCSILEEENHDQMEHFIKTYDLELSSSPFATFPSCEGMDGFFAVVLRKSKK